MLAHFNQTDLFFTNWLMQTQLCIVHQYQVKFSGNVSWAFFKYVSLSYVEVVVFNEFFICPYQIQYLLFECFKIPQGSNGRRRDVSRSLDDGTRLTNRMFQAHIKYRPEGWWIHLQQGIGSGCLIHFWLYSAEPNFSFFRLAIIQLDCQYKILDRSLNKVYMAKPVRYWAMGILIFLCWRRVNAVVCKHTYGSSFVFSWIVNLSQLESKRIF